EFDRAKKLKEVAARSRESEMKNEQQKLAENSFTAPLLLVISQTSDKSSVKLRAELNDTLARAYFNLGVMYLKRDQFEKGAQHFARANQWATNFPQLQFYLGLSRYKAGQFCEAAPPLELAIRQD